MIDRLDRLWLATVSAITVLLNGLLLWKPSLSLVVVSSLAPIILGLTRTGLLPVSQPRQMRHWGGTLVVAAGACIGLSSSITWALAGAGESGSE
jgi:hypothetical protein